MTKATPARWIPADEFDDKKKRSSWTEVISTKKKHDPFAGMKSCVDYEQEIERIKQLVPKVDHRKRSPKTSTASSSSSTISDTSSTNSTTTATTITPTLYNINNININNNSTNINNTPKTPTTSVPSLYSRSSSPCSDNHDSSDDAESVPEQTSVITEEEKARFLAFVRSWTGDWKGGWNSSTVELNSGSLWTEQSPWDTAPQYRNQHVVNTHNHPLVVAMPTPTTPTVMEPTEQNTSELYWQWKRPSHYSSKYPQPIQRPIRPF